MLAYGQQKVHNILTMNVNTQNVPSTKKVWIKSISYWLK